MDAEAIMSQTQVKKTPHWKPEMMFVHNKVQLYKRLEQHNQNDTSLEYIRLDHDPRTGLELVTIPKSHDYLFKGGPFRTEREPLLHYFGLCDKMTHKLGYPCALLYDERVHGLMGVWVNGA